LTDEVDSASDDAELPLPIEVEAGKAKPSRESKPKPKKPKLSPAQAASFLASLKGLDMEARLKRVDSFVQRHGVDRGTLGVKAAVAHGDEFCKGWTMICLDLPVDEPRQAAWMKALLAEVGAQLDTAGRSYDVQADHNSVIVRKADIRFRALRATLAAKNVKMYWADLGVG